MLFYRKTGFATLDIALKRIYRNKSELLFVLKRSDVPSHNNLSERDIREYVKRRKISGSTRSDIGQECRDTFTSLKKTCLKLGLSFWQYLKDRIEYQNKYSPLAEIMQSQMIQSVQPAEAKTPAQNPFYSRCASRQAVTPASYARF